MTGGATAGDAPFDDCFADLVGTVDGLNLGTDFIDFVDQQGDPRLRIARAVWCGTCDMKTPDIRLVGFAFKDGDEQTCITCTDHLDYSTGHHNMLEQAIATTATTEYWVDMVYDFEGDRWVDELTAFDPEDLSLLWGPEELTATRCTSDPPGQYVLCTGR